MRGRPHPASTTGKSTPGGSGSREQTSRSAARAVALAESDPARRELPPLDVAEREVLVDLEADRGQGGLGLDGQPRIRPAAEPALEDPHVLEAALAEAVDDARARGLFRARAVRDEELVGLEVQVRRLRALRIEPYGAGQLRGAR